MLLQFSCSNHKSIKEPVVFSMIASKDSSNLYGLKKFSNFNVVRIASIYGANGSGKSNFVDAIRFSRNLIVNSLKNLPGTPVIQTPHKLADSSSPSKYEFQFVIEDLRFAYGFSIKNFLINDEYLYYFPKNRKTKIFERQDMKIIPGSKYKNAFNLSIQALLKPNRLFLTCAASYSNISEIEQAFIFFNRDIILYRTEVDEPRTNNWYEYSIELMEQHPEIKDAFIEVLSKFDTGILDIKPDIKRINIPELKKKLPEDVIYVPNLPNEFKYVQAKIVYSNFETDLMTEESTGIKKLVQIICPILDIIMNGKILIYDEIETGLHESIIHQLIKLFYALMPNKFAQLIFTTHDTSLLDMEMFRRDQIWFTQLTPERATDLYSLIEIKNVRKNEKLSKGYISGKYGAIPVLNQTFIEQLEALRGHE